MLYAIKHITQYRYHDRVSLCHNIATLVPRDTHTQLCQSFSLIIDPLPQILEEHFDFYGNKLYYFVIEQEHEELTVTVNSEVRKLPIQINPSAYPTQSWETAKSQITESNGEFVTEKQFIYPTPFTAYDSSIKQYAEQSFLPGQSFFNATLDLVRRIHDDFIFTPGFTTTSTPLSVVMKERKGVCQDFAHLAISCIHSMGLPAKYVSGYIETLPPDGTEKLVGVDASHAWISIFIPAAGWVDFDPTNNKIATEQYITVAWGRDYFDIVPLKGVILSSHSHDMIVKVDVRRLNER